MAHPQHVILIAICHIPSALLSSRTAKELREAISGAQLDAGDLEQQQQHLKRQLATLADRIKRLESQVGRGSAANSAQHAAGLMQLVVPLADNHPG